MYEWSYIGMALFATCMHELCPCRFQASCFAWCITELKIIELLREVLGKKEGKILGVTLRCVSEGGREGGRAVCSHIGTTSASSVGAPDINSINMTLHVFIFLPPEIHPGPVRILH